MLYCDPSAAPGGDGTQLRPFSLVAEAVRAAAGVPASTIVLRGGVYHERMVVLGPEHSGLTIQNYQGEHAVVSGAAPLARAGQKGKPQWVKVPVEQAAPGKGNWTLWPEVNNVFARAPNPNGDNPAAKIKYLGNFFTFFLFAIIDCLACKFQPFLTRAIADAPSVVSQLPSFSKKCQKPRDSL